MSSIRWNASSLIFVQRRVQRVAGVVDDDVELAERVDRRRDERLRHARLGQVAAVHRRLARDLVSDLRREVRVQVVDHDLRAVLGQQLSGGAADPARRAGHDRDLPVEDSHCRDDIGGPPIAGGAGPRSPVTGSWC
jgi:hypothetical protein